MTRILLLRHAKPVSAGQYIGRGSNPALSSEGCIMAGKIVPALNMEKPHFLYSSPLRRALETIAPFSRKTGMDITVSEDLAEMDFGAWEGLGWKEIEHKDQFLWHSWIENPWQHAPPGGETLQEFQHRVVTALHAILSRHPGETILLSTHGGPIRIMLGYALCLEPATFWSAHIDYACLCRFQQHHQGTLNLLQWNIPLCDSA